MRAAERTWLPGGARLACAARGRASWRRGAPKRRELRRARIARRSCSWGWGNWKGRPTASTSDAQGVSPKGWPGALGSTRSPPWGPTPRAGRRLKGVGRMGFPPWGFLVSGGASERGFQGGKPRRGTSGTSLCHFAGRPTASTPGAGRSAASKPRLPISCDAPFDEAGRGRVTFGPREAKRRSRAGDTGCDSGAQAAAVKSGALGEGLLLRHLHHCLQALAQCVAERRLRTFGPRALLLPRLPARGDPPLLPLAPFLQFRLRDLLPRAPTF